ncbi:MAG: response regulator transcription factor [Candidatus Shapirobacteria bacterium]
MKVLIVEDEHRIASAIKKGLEQEKMVTDVAYDGVEGLDLAMEGSYDVILMDLMLPGMDGMKVVENLRNSQINTPILMLTARGQIEDKVNGLGVGADDYLTKPFAFEELLARIRALTRRPKVIESTNMRAGDVIMNKDNFEVIINGTRTPLSAKEYGLLEYMMKNKGKTLTKDQIREHVWNYDSNILPNTIEVYIKKLRAKKVSIDTVRGFGYRLRDVNV